MVILLSSMLKSDEPASEHGLLMNLCFMTFNRELLNEQLILLSVINKHFHMKVNNRFR